MFTLTKFKDYYENISSLQDFEHKNVQNRLYMGLSFMLFLTNNTIRIRTSTNMLPYIKLNNKFYSLVQMMFKLQWKKMINMNYFKHEFE